jgi:hypothetical protein
MSNIDFVIISSDDNPFYKDFYFIVAKQWKLLGFKTYYINITDEDKIEENEFGIIHKIKKLDFVSTGFQSQVIRLFSSNFIENKNILMSDIDMLPLNRNYFLENSKQLMDNNIILYSGQPYGNVPYYPMCYVLGNSNYIKNILEIDNVNFESYCKILFNFYGEKWNTDEHFLYDKLQNHKDNLIIKNDRDFKRRIDRSNWVYDINKLKNGYYIDSHLLRPYNLYYNEINKLLNVL